MIHHRSLFASLSFTGLSLFHHSRSDEKKVPPIIPGWSHAFSKEGDKFWYNESTGETRWRHPDEQKWSKTWDGRKEGKKGVIHQIVLIRHGQYEEKEEKDENRKLTALGRKQAEMTGKRLNELLAANVLSPVKCVYYSTMKRATETSDIILQQLSSSPSESISFKTEPCSMIREGAVCRPDPAAEAWHVSDEDFDKEGARVLAGFKNHIHRAGPEEETSYTTILVCHGNVIRYLVLKALQLDPHAWLRLAVYNGSITILEVRSNGGVSLRALGDTAHMPAQDISYSLRH